MDAPPIPFRQFVLKMHSRCDLACDHCYIYEHEDTSWRGRPKAVSDEVLAQTAFRIREHVMAHSLSAVHVVLHGGEPLLAGPEKLRRAAKELQGALNGLCELDLRIHTNGVRLDERFCDLFGELGIKVGISLDGGRPANDLHRRFADGRSSHPQVLLAVALLNQPRYRHLYSGLLCTIDVRNEPSAVYDALLALDPPRIDFLLPHATWDHPPLRPDGDPTPYATWLETIFQRWDAEGRQVPVRFFDSVLRTLRGRSSLTESLGLAPADLVVIETDGTLEQADSLKTSYDGAAATGFDVFRHSMDEASRHPGMMDRQQGAAGLSEQCQACPVVESCGGGLYAHRYRTGSGFANPSVFCEDLLKLITGIRDRTVRHDRTVHHAEPVPSAAPDLGTLGLTENQFDSLAAGFGDADTVGGLARAALELSRNLLAAVWDRAATSRGRPAADWELLTELDKETPQALDEVLAHPYTRAWAVRCLAGRPGADLGGLAEIAAAAALRAGRTDEVLVPVRDGVLRLPTLGRVLVGGTDAIVSGDAEGFAVRPAGTAGSGGEALRIAWGGPSTDRWQPVRRVGLPGWQVALEDTDPHRDGYHPWPVAARLPEAEAEAWRTGLAGAWRLITEELPQYVPGVAAGLGSITPLRPAPGGRDASAAARDAFGAVGIARPERSDLLALLIVHEFQHVKLGALLDFTDLFDPDDTGLYYAPWRDDPRPLEGLLQGAYAHIAVTDFWRVRRRSDARAEAHFARWRTQTSDAIDTLLASRSFTPAGQRFAAALRNTADHWLTESVDPAALAAARRAADEHRAAWSARAAGVGGRHG